MRQLLSASLAVLALAGTAEAQNGQSLVRGNVPGEWRYWGGDAWSTRYSPLDQINARNFDSLQVAWQWNASAFGADEYYRTTPLYANGRLFTVATTRRIAAAIPYVPAPKSGRVKVGLLAGACGYPPPSVTVKVRSASIRRTLTATFCPGVVRSMR